MTNVVNIVGTGDLNREIDLSCLSEDIKAFHVKHRTGSGPGLYIKFDESSPTIIISTSGKYIVTGVNNLTALNTEYERLIHRLNSLGIDITCSSPPDVKNIVCTANLKSSIDLSALSIELGLEYVEYEPEQFPGLIFRPKNSESVLLIFNTGKVVITGVTSKKSAVDAFNQLTIKIDALTDRS